MITYSPFINFWRAIDEGRARQSQRGLMFEDALRLWLQVTRPEASA